MGLINNTSLQSTSIVLWVTFNVIDWFARTFNKRWDFKFTIIFARHTHTNISCFSFDFFFLNVHVEQMSFRAGATQDRDIIKYWKMYLLIIFSFHGICFFPQKEKYTSLKSQTTITLRVKGYFKAQHGTAAALCRPHTSLSCVSVDRCVFPHSSFPIQSSHRNSITLQRL